MLDDTSVSVPASGYPATFLDGWSMAETRVRVEPSSDGLRITDELGGLRGLWGRAGLHCDAMQEGGVLHVTHASFEHETLVVRDAELSRRLLAMSGRVSAIPGGTRKLQLALSWLLGLVALGAVFYYATPVIAHFVAVRIPLEQERALGAEVETLLDFADCSDEAAQAALQTLAARLAERGAPRYEVRLMHSEMPNAFALPGGTIVFTDGLLRDARSSDEVAGVLAHEIEHVVQRHVLAGFLRGAALSALWAVTMGDYSGLLVIDPSTAYRIANLEFSRGDEEAADRGAALRLHRAGLSHRGLVTFFERLQKKHGDHGPAWLSTHPSTRDRIARLRASADVAHPQELLTATQFQAFQRACGGKAK